MVYSLKDAVKDAIAQKDISGIYPVFMASRMYVAGKHMPDGMNLFLTTPPGRNSMCITASDYRAVMEKIPNIDIMEMDGSELFNHAGDDLEIMLYFDDGGYMLTRAQLDWFKKLDAQA